MDLQSVMLELEALGKERTRNTYVNNGAQQPLFGVATGAMKPIAKKIKRNQQLADELYETGNYDAMYFAGIIAEPNTMTKAHFNAWIERAYFYMLSDYVVAVTLAEAPIAQEVADEWIASNEDLKMSAGWSCYCWLLGNQKDENFNRDKLLKMLHFVAQNIHSAPNRTKASMNNFVTTVAISYKPLHEDATAIAAQIGQVEMPQANGKSTFLHAHAQIIKEIERNRIGFKRKYVRC